MYSQHAALVRRLAPRYAKAIDDLITPMGLPDVIPTVAALEALAQQSPYFAEERSERWRTHLEGCDPVTKSAEVTIRRMHVLFSEARFKKMCAYCWLQVHCCMCARIVGRSPAVQLAMRDPNYEANVAPYLREMGATEGGVCTNAPCANAAECGGHPSSSPAVSAAPVAVPCKATTNNNKADTPRPQVKVTFILHSQEVLRMTNSAHVAAMAMNAGLLVWGLPRHDERIAELGRYWEANPPRAGCGLGWPIGADADHSEAAAKASHPISRNAHGIAAEAFGSDSSNFYADGTRKKFKSRKDRTEPVYERTTTNSVQRRKKNAVGGTEADEASIGCDGSSPTTTATDFDADELADLADMSVLLYPAVDASIPFEQLLAYRNALALTADTPASDVAPTEAAAPTNADGATLSAPATSSIVRHGDSAASVPSLHIYLSDGTWSQARVVNRQVPNRMPRVALDISARYSALFQGLRKRTRESGVSTLEATTIAVSQAVAKDAACGLFSYCEADRPIEVSYDEEADGSDVEASTADAAETAAPAGAPLPIAAPSGSGPHVHVTRKELKKNKKLMLMLKAAAEAEGRGDSVPDVCPITGALRVAGSADEYHPAARKAQARLKGSVAAAATASDDEMEIDAARRLTPRGTSPPSNNAEAGRQPQTTETITTPPPAPATAPTTVAASVVGLESSLFDLMRQFVDIVAIVSTKHYARRTQTSLTAAEVRALVDGENAYKVEMQRLIEAANGEPTADDVRHLLPAPVTNFCYVCDMFIGYQRMVGHVAGKEHRRRLVEKGSGFEPTEASKRVRKSTIGVVAFNPDGSSSDTEQPPVASE